MPRVGISAVITGDRSLGTSRLASLTDNKLVMRLADRGDYSLIGLSARSVPNLVPPGRGFFVDGAVETQVAMLADDESGQGQGAAIAEIAKAAHVRDALVPRHQPALPGRRPAVPALLRAGVGDAAGRRRSAVRAGGRRW